MWGPRLEPLLPRRSLSEQVCWLSPSCHPPFCRDSASFLCSPLSFFPHLCTFRASQQTGTEVGETTGNVRNMIALVPSCHVLPAVVVNRVPAGGGHRADSICCPHLTLCLLRDASCFRVLVLFCLSGLLLCLSRRGSPLLCGVSLGRDIDFPSASPSLIVPAILWLTPLQELPTFLGPLISSLFPCLYF